MTDEVNVAVPGIPGNVVIWLKIFPCNLNSQRENKPTRE